jgi:hypothetical protein
MNYPDPTGISAEICFPPIGGEYRRYLKTMGESGEKTRESGESGQANGNTRSRSQDLWI